MALLETWAPSQYPKRRLSVRSRRVSKPQDLYLELSYCSEIWQALPQQCCRCACQISKRYDNLKYQSRGFETWRDLTERRLFGYWDGAQELVATCWDGAGGWNAFSWITTTAYSFVIQRAHLLFSGIYGLSNKMITFGSGLVIQARSCCHTEREIESCVLGTVMSLLEAPYLIEAPQMGLQVVTK